MVEDTRARFLLDTLVVEPGALRIITNLPDAGAPTADPRDPAYWVQYDATSVEDIPGGLVMAHSLEGAVTIGYPVDVLVRLTEHAHYDPEDPISTRARVEAALDAL